MADESTKYDDLLSRRRFAQLAGATGAAALAGCDSDGGGNGTETDDGSGGAQPEYPDGRHSGVTGANPANVQWNVANGQNSPQLSHHLLFEKFGQWGYNEGQFKPAGLSDWEDSGDAFEMTIRDGLTWSNGDAVTADDVITQLRLEKANEDPMWDWAESVEKVDDKTVRINKGSNVNPNLVQFDVLQRYMFVDEATYGDILSKIQDGGEVSEYTGFSDKDPNTNGPFTLSARDQQVLLMEWNADSPWSKNINFGEYALQSVSGNQSRQQALVSMLVDSDYSVATPQSVVQQMPKAVKQIKVPNVFGVGLTPNHDDDIAGDRAVRQAIAHLINREQAVKNSLPASKQAPDIPTAIPSDAQDKWLGDKKSKYNSYGKSSRQTEKAKNVLEDAGYTKSGGSWQTPDGNKLSVTFSHPPGWSDWILALESAAQDISDFGIDASVEAVSSYSNARSSGDFQFLAHTWLHNSPSTYPYYSTRHQMVDHQSFPTKYNYPAAVEARGGSKADITVPAMSGDGEMTINPASKNSTLGETSDSGKAKTIIQELAWVANQDLPHIPIAEKLLQQWVTADEWGVPDNVSEASDANVQWAPTWLPRKGKMDYKPQ